MTLVVLLIGLMERKAEHLMNSDFIVAVHAMTFLCHKNQLLSSEELADNVCTNPARVRRVMSKLKKAGLVKTREGRTGGGFFSDTAGNVTLGEISAALDVDFAEFNWRSGDEDRDCMICSGMSDYMDMISKAINQRCSEYLSEVKVSEAEQWLKDRK